MKQYFSARSWCKYLSCSVKIIVTDRFTLKGMLLVMTFSLAYSTDVLSETPRLPAVRDCLECPEMVIVPAGNFVMGANQAALVEAGIPKFEYMSSLPQHSILVKSFAMATHEITVKEFDTFTKETGYVPTGCYFYKSKPGFFVGVGWVTSQRASWRDPGFDQSDKYPVVCVSWEDAQKYIHWLNTKVASSSLLSKVVRSLYRLPSEAEWEYAARAGINAERYWDGNVTIQCDAVNAADLTTKKHYPDWPGPVAPCKDAFPAASPVDAFRPNEWGLYDMLGNVLQWTEDCYSDYVGENSDSRARKIGNCGMHVVRGGAWTFPPMTLYLTRRTGRATGVRRSDTGFRLARDLQ